MIESTKCECMAEHFNNTLKDIYEGIYVKLTELYNILHYKHKPEKVTNIKVGKHIAVIFNCSHSGEYPGSHCLNFATKDGNIEVHEDESLFPNKAIVIFENNYGQLTINGLENKLDGLENKLK